MLHEVIFALNGTCGNVLSQILHMADCETYIHPSEKALLYTILEISESYKFLKDFIDSVPAFGNNVVQFREEQLMPGLYLRAFCDGLYQGLEPYRKNLVSLEKLILNEPYTTLSTIVSMMDGFNDLVDILKAIVKQIIARQIHGCKILQHVHTYMATDKSVLANALSRITQMCHKVMLKQLANWMLCGEVMDPYKEFFIQSFSIDNNINANTSCSTLYSESLPDTGEDEQLVYKLVADFLPSYIPLSLANKALFIGNTILMFTKDKQSGNTNNLDLSVYSKTENIWLGKVQALHNCSNLDVNILENTINDIRCCVTQHFWTLTKDVAGVFDQLKLCKDFYLLGRGEMFVVFLRKASHILKTSVSTHSNRDLNNIFQASARTCLASETVLDKFYFNVPPKDSVITGTTVWSVLKLEFKVTWPLHLLFTPTVINSYNTLFHFLLNIKMAELNLHEVWITLIKNKSERPVSDELQICNKLMFLIQNLEFYLQLDVLDSQDKLFQTALKSYCDFDQIMQAHNVFLANVISQAFLLPTEVTQQDQPVMREPHPVNMLIMNILELSEDFCNIVINNSEQKLFEIKEKLEFFISSLLRLMNINDKASGNHLSKLMLRLDYNKFFSSIESSSVNFSTLSDSESTMD